MYEFSRRAPLTLVAFLLLSITRATTAVAEDAAKNDDSGGFYHFVTIVASKEWLAAHKVFVIVDDKRHDLPILLASQPVEADKARDEKGGTGVSNDSTEVNGNPVRNGIVTLHFRAETIKIQVEPLSPIRLSSGGADIIPGVRKPVAKFVLVPSEDQDAKFVLDPEQVRKMVSSGKVISEKQQPAP